MAFPELQLTGIKIYGRDLKLVVFQIQARKTAWNVLVKALVKATQTIEQRNQTERELFVWKLFNKERPAR